jgi:uncharacterized membrane protein
MTDAAPTHTRRTRTTAAGALDRAAQSGETFGAEAGLARFAGVIERRGLAVLYLFTAAAVLGFALFGQDASRLARLPAWAISFYGRSFSVFALGHIALAMVVLAAVLVVRTGGAWLGVFGLAYAVSLASELGGTTWGLPFGDYRYSPILSPMWLDRVPVVIPLSWFFMALPSYALVAPWLRSGWSRVVLGSWVLLAWDLALDPAMSHATRYWTWGEGGPYYGMPLLNLFGWYVTGVVLMALFAWRGAERWTERVPAGWWGGFYGANLLLPLGLCMAAGLWWAVAATLSVLLLAALAVGWRVYQRGAA